MTKFYFLLLAYMICSHCYAKDYYVSSDSGNNSNNGTSPSTPFKTIQHAADLTIPGDIVYVMNGTYTSEEAEWSIVNITRSGTASKWITYTNYPGHSPLLFFTGSGISLSKQVSYIIINGFTIKGNNDNITLSTALNQPGGCKNPNGTIDPKFNGNGITMWAEANIEKIHHIKITNNTIYNSPAGGIYGSRCDYITIENNLIYNNGWYTLYGSSGIAFYQNSNYDQTTSGYRMIIKNNKLLNNYNLVPWLVNCEIHDGNGIIIDDSNHTQNGSTVPEYSGRTLISNNIIYGSGGPGVHIYESGHVDVINNTTYYNQQTAGNFNGEIDARNSKDVVIRNNIMYSKPGKPINTVVNSSNVVIDHNLFYGGNGSSTQGTNAINADPYFLDPSLTLSADFQLQILSPAIDSGSGVLAPDNDYSGNPRPFGCGYEIGAFEFGSKPGVKDSATLNKSLTLYPNPASDFIFIDQEEIKELVIYDLTGKSILTNDSGVTKKIEVSGLKAGYYLLIITTMDGKSQSSKFYKQ